MALINKTATDKGFPAVFTLDKEELLSLIPEGHYFKNTSHWRLVSLNYQSPDKSQNIFVTLNASFEVPEGTFLSSPRSRENFEIRYITIHDFDGGKYTLDREIIPALELSVMDVELPPLLRLEDGNFLTNEDGSFINL